MERIIIFILFCIAVEGRIGKHIYVPYSLNWNEAQTHCQLYHTDLSYFNSWSDIYKFQKDVGGIIHKGWIGLHRDPNNNSAWMWSGGGHIAYQNWGAELLDYYLDWNAQHSGGVYLENVAITFYGNWIGLDGSDEIPFYCMNVTVVEEKMSWEDALSHCREKQTDLPSLLSDTDLLLTQAEIQYITERVWIGLRFLGDRWLWVNGDPLEYEAWSLEGGQDHQCPIRKRCGALTRDKLWENRDCEEKLYFICA